MASGSDSTGDYTNMSAYYDAIMTSGYYDYEAIVDSLLSQGPVQSVLEIGCGTGLFSRGLAARGEARSAVLTDVSVGMLRLCRQLIQQLRGYLFQV